MQNIPLSLTFCSAGNIINNIECISRKEFFIYETVLRQSRIVMAKIQRTSS